MAEVVMVWSRGVTADVDGSHAHTALACSRSLVSSEPPARGTGSKGVSVSE